MKSSFLLRFILSITVGEVDMYIFHQVFGYGENREFLRNFPPSTNEIFLLIYNPFHKDTEPTISFGYSVTSEGRSI